MSLASSVSEISCTPPGRLSRNAVRLKNLVLGTLFCLTPLTAIVALGWMMRTMQAVTNLHLLQPARAVKLQSSSVNWFAGSQETGLVSRLFGGFWSNLKTGFGGFVALLLATLPFTGLWLVSWWAGWENSFNKGYEQAAIGPLTGLAGVGVGLWIMAHLPMALAHQAAKNRFLALFQIAKIRKLVAHGGWSYLALAVAFVLLALPLFAARGLPVFIEQINPGFADMSRAEVKNFASLMALAKAAYIFVTLVFLRKWSARIYARAVNNIAGDDLSRRNRPRWMFGLVRLLLLFVIWFGLVSQIYVAQFLNHNWWTWLNHPYLLLPFAF